VELLLQMMNLLAKRAKHITTTAKIPHPYEYVHDEIGYNYRLPNINAALLVAQLEQLEKFLASKRELAKNIKSFFQNNINFIEEPKIVNQTIGFKQFY
jgi:perosamine synthetase